jgi:hypothetical protein
VSVGFVDMFIEPVAGDDKLGAAGAEPTVVKVKLGFDQALVPTEFFALTLQ